jgi:hypothetical protein
VTGAELALENPPGPGDGQRLDDLGGAGQLVVGDVLPAEVRELVSGQDGARLQDDDGVDALAVVVVGTR